MTRDLSLTALLVLAALAVPARALIPSASDVVQGVLDDSQKESSIDRDFNSPGVVPDPDPLEKYKGLRIKPTAADLTAHDAWIKRQAAQSEPADTLLESLSSAKDAGAGEISQSRRKSEERLTQGQFYSYAANGSAQLFSGDVAIKTSASGLRALYQTLSEQDAEASASAARLSGAPGAAARDAQADDSGEAAASAPSQAAGETPATGDAAAMAAKSILPAFAPLGGGSAGAPAASAAAPLPSAAEPPPVPPPLPPPPTLARGASSARAQPAKSGALQGFSRSRQPSAADLREDTKGSGDDLFNGNGGGAQP